MQQQDCLKQSSDFCLEYVLRQLYHEMAPLFLRCLTSAMSQLSPYPGIEIKGLNPTGGIFVQPRKLLRMRPLI